MRNCPVCEKEHRSEVFRTTYRVPDGWPLPNEVVWYDCDICGMVYGDGDFDQAMLSRYYQERYGYGLGHPDNVARLVADARAIALDAAPNSVVVDFGGGGEDGKSVLVEELVRLGRLGCCVNVDDFLPPCDVLYASHVLEHIYDFKETVERLVKAIKPDGLLIVDVPDSMNQYLGRCTPLLDYHSKHINHFTLRTLLDLGRRHGFEATKTRAYTLHGNACLQVHFRRIDVARASAVYVWKEMDNRLRKLQKIDRPVNVWGLSDIAWHLLSMVDLEVLDYIDSDPAYRGQTYNGKPVWDRVMNRAPIVVMAQQQRRTLVEYIREHCNNEIIEV